MGDWTSFDPASVGADLAGALVQYPDTLGRICDYTDFFSRVHATGALCVVAGNLMPKADRNPFFGLRTPWSEASPETWRRSQRLGGYAGVATGFAMIVLGLVLPARLVTPAVLLMLLAGFAAAIVGSYVIYRQELGKQ